MKIEWNRVTWYSKAIALGVFVGLVIVAFWFGVGYGQLAATLAIKTAVPMATSTPSAQNSAGVEYYGNVAEWQTYNDTQGGYAVAYPIDFSTDENYSSAKTQDWQVLGTPTLGSLGFMLTIPSSFEPQTNFADAKLTIGWSGNSSAVAECMTTLGSDFGPGAFATSSATINGTNFTVFHMNSAGAGNLYKTTSYRTIHAGQCYAIEYTIHSSQIANYPASYDLHPFDEKPLTDLLDKIVGTFKFGQ